MNEKKIIKCKCGCMLVMNDNHLICSSYLQDIITGIKQQQEIIEELNGEDII